MDLCSQLEHLLSVLVEIGADGFDPARWCYIASLARRAREKQGAVKHRIAQISLAALDDYRNEFEREREKAVNMMARAASEYPDVTESMQRFYAKGDFRGMRRVFGRLFQQHHRGVLIPLTNRIMGGAHALERNKMPLTLDELLRQQDAQVLQPAGSAAAPRTDPFPSAETVDLNPFHLFRKTWSTLYSDRLVARAMKDRPENAGPLNSQMLATRSLFIMRKLSPSYLNRFVSYMDALLWLEQVGEENTPRTDKKRNRFK